MTSKQFNIESLVSSFNLMYPKIANLNSKLDETSIDASTMQLW